jgi:Flp pilus assembly protein TadG
MAQVRQLLRRLRREEAAQLIEFALVLPLLLFVMVGIAEFGFVFQRYEVLTNAAREGARIAVLPGYTAADVQARVASYVTAGRVPTAAGNPVVLVENIAIPVGGGLPALTARRVTVTYTYTYMFIPNIAAIFGATYNTIALTAVSEMRSEIIAGI